MLDQTKKKDVGRGANAVAAKFNVDKLDQDELLVLYEEVRARLPGLTLVNLNVEEELLLQFYKIRKLQSEVIDAQDVAANQKAQVANSVSAALSKISDLQREIYESERFKRIEFLLIKHLRTVSEEFAEKFLAEYEEIFGDDAK